MDIIKEFQQRKVQLGSNNAFNPNILGKVTEAYAANSVASVANIYYQKTGIANAINVFVPVKNSKFAKYPIIVDNGGFQRLDSASIGTIGVNELGRRNATYGGTWVTSSPPEYYTTIIGSTFSFSFSGTKISIYSTVDTRGGLWSISIDGGTPIVISTWAASKTFASQLISDTLSDTSHTLIATFLGQDPVHPYATPRGWLYHGNNTTTGGLIIYSVSYLQDKPIMPVSNVEFAYMCRRYGSGVSVQWIPTHDTNTTTTPISRKILVDNIEVLDFTVSEILSCQKVEIKSTYTGFNTNESAQSLVEVTINNKIDKYGYHVDFKLKVLQKMNIDNYSFMLPINRNFGTLLETNQPETYSLTDASGVITPLTNYDDITSFKVSSNLAGCENYQLTAALVNKNAMRLGYSDRGNANNPYPLTWIENRVNATIQKLYMSTFRGSVLEAGTEISSKAVYYIGCIS